MKFILNTKEMSAVASALLLLLMIGTSAVNAATESKKVTLSEAGRNRAQAEKNLNRAVKKVLDKKIRLVSRIICGPNKSSKSRSKAVLCTGTFEGLVKVSKKRDNDLSNLPPIELITITKSGRNRGDAQRKAKEEADIILRNPVFRDIECGEPRFNVPLNLQRRCTVTFSGRREI